MIQMIKEKQQKHKNSNNWATKLQAQPVESVPGPFLASRLCDGAGGIGVVWGTSKRIPGGLSMIFSRLAFPHFWYQPDWCFVMGLSRPKMMKALSNSAEVSEERMHFWVEVAANIRSLWNGTNGSNMSLSLQACLSRPVEHLNVAIAFLFYVCRYVNTQTCRTCRMNQTYIEFDRASLNMIFSFFSIPDLLPDEVMHWRWDRPNCSKGGFENLASKMVVWFAFGGVACCLPAMSGSTLYSRQAIFHSCPCGEWVEWVEWALWWYMNIYDMFWSIR